MVWQRLLSVGLYAVVVTSVAHGAPAVELSPPEFEAKPTPDENQVVRSKTALPEHHVRSTAAIRKAEARSASSASSADFVHPRDRRVGQVGYASWYGGERNGMRTASGRRFDKNELTAAHPTLPLQSKVQVTNMANGRTVTVRITDRGPWGNGRIIDLSQSAAEEIGMRNLGVARVQVEPVVANTIQ